MTKTNTTTRTAANVNAANPLGFYADTLKGWNSKYAGAKPTADQFKTAHQLGARPGTKTAVAIAMYLRDNGATQGQVFVVNGGPYLNKMRALIEAGHAVRVPMSADASGHTVYKLALPTKKASKAKTPRKPRVREAEKATPAAEPAKAE